MAKRGTSEKRKKILAGALGGILVLVFAYQIFFSKPTPRPTRSPAGTTTAGTPAPATSATSAPAAPQKSLSAAARQEALVHELLSDMTPLNLSMIQKTGGRAEPGPRGNIFGYYVEPPKPPPPPPPPPPIQLLGMQPQGAVAGTPRPFTLILTGNKIPADAQILFDGAPRATKRMGETQLSTEVSPGDYSYPRNINIEVKSQSDPANNSNAMTFVVQAGPEPQFIYKGRLGALNQPLYNYAVFELTSTKEIKRGKVGDTIMGVWRIDAITAEAVDITHTQYDIKKRVPLQDKLR